MIDHELKNIWDKSSQKERVKLDITKLLIELKNEMNNFDRKIKRRDRREIIACFIGMVGFGIMTIYIPFIVTKIACILTIGWFGYVIHRLRNVSRQAEPDVTLSFRDQLNQRKQYLQKQADLLRSVLYWYILPPFIINAIFLFGIGDLSTWDSFFAEILPATFAEKLACLGFAGAIYAYILWMNRKAAKVNIQPLIDDIEKIQAQLDRED